MEPHLCLSWALRSESNSLKQLLFFGGVQNGVSITNPPLRAVAKVDMRQVKAFGVVHRKWI